jgi:hypothetical protein
MVPGEHGVAILLSAVAGELHGLGDHGAAQCPGSLGGCGYGEWHERRRSQEQDGEGVATPSVAGGHLDAGVDKANGEGGVGKPQDGIRRR